MGPSCVHHRRRADDLEEEVGGARVVAEIADLVDDEESTRGVVVEPPAEPARRLLRAQIEEEFGGGLEEYVVAGEDGGVGDVLRDHRLAEALGRHEHDVARAREEVEPQRGLDRRAVDTLRPRPIEVAHRGESAKAASQKAALESAARALLLLALREMLEELGRAPPAFGREGDDVVEMRGGVTQAEGGEGVNQVAHWTAPRRAGRDRSSARGRRPQ